MKLVASNYDNHLDVSSKIREVGFSLIPHEKEKIRKKLQNLQERAPATSSIRITFILETVQIKGSLVINGAGKNFRAISSGGCPMKIYNVLEKEIDKQLIEWKKARFSTYSNDNRPLPRINNEVLFGGYCV